MTKRFCNSCDRELRNSELYFSLKLSAIRDSEVIGPNEFYNDFCYECTKSGKCFNKLEQLAVRIKHYIDGGEKPIDPTKFNEGFENK